MRIISGIYKGRQINVPNNFKLRPTTDLAKEALFNIINNWYDFEDLDVLDLFSGTGSITYEFISRECKSITSVEKNPKHYEFIQKFTKELKAPNSRVFKADVFVYLENCKQKFDLIFADPPYELPEILTIPDAVFKNNLLNESGTLIVEHSPNTDFSKHKNFIETRHYGKVNYSVFENLKENVAE